MKIAKATTLTVLMLAALPAESAIVERPVSGEITAVNGASGIAVGDDVSGSVAYDDAGIEAGTFSFVPLDGSTSGLAPGSLEITFPSDGDPLVLNEADDDGFGAGFPSINFNSSGEFAGISTEVSGIDAFGRDDADLTFRGTGFSRSFGFFDDGTEVVSGRLSLGDERPTAVPLPGSGILLSIGCLGLGIARIRRRASA